MGRTDGRGSDNKIKIVDEVRMAKIFKSCWSLEFYRGRTKL